MEFYEVLNNRRTVREWSEETVGEDVLERILNAALRAPSNNHMRQWEFIVLRTAEEKECALQYVKEQAAVQAANLHLPEHTPEQKMYAYALPRQYSMLRDAPYVIIPLFRTNQALFKATAVNGLNAFASIWCVIENLFLAAAAEGLACSLRIPVGPEGSDVCRTLGVPEDYLMACYIGIGHPAEGAENPEQYTFTAKEKIHEGRW